MAAPIPARWLTAIGGVVTLLALSGIGARATYGARTTADEPQYLLTATSLAADGDLDIANQLDARSYLPYHEIPVDTQTRELDDSGRRVSPHDPLLPVILAVPMAAGGWIAAKAMLAGVAGLTAALTAWVANRRFGVDRVAATVATVGCFAGIPLAPYGTQVYPEMPAALLVVAATAALTGAPDRRTLPASAVTLAAIIGLPWLAVKYVPVAAVLGVALLARSRHRTPPQQRTLIVTVLAVAIGAGAAYLWSHQAIYGGWTVYASGDHFESTGEFAVVGTDMNLIGRSRRLIGLLVDRRFGIAVWSPIWFVLPAAVATAVRQGRRTRSSKPGRRRLCAAVVGSGWLTATFVALTMHGWWVPGRQVVVVLPIAAVLVSTWAAGERWRQLVVGLLGAIGLVNWLWLAVEATTGRRTLVVDFAETSAPLYRSLSPLFPDGIAGGAMNDLGLVVWAVAVVIIAWWGSGLGRPDATPDARSATPDLRFDEAAPSQASIAPGSRNDRVTSDR